MSSSPSRAQIASAFAAVYIIWGSTYLGIRFAVETLPPFFMAGVRFIISGIILYTWARLRGAEKPKLIHWKSASIIGGFLLLMGNGGVVWAEQWVPSGITALIIASSPLWFVIIDSMQHKTLPTLDVVVGLVLGSIGILLLIDPTNLVGGDEVYLPGAVVILFATVAWAYGSLYSRKAKLPSAPLLTTGMEMLAGGVLLILAGLLVGEVDKFDPAIVSSRSLLALGYLIAFGSLVGFTSYVWLLRVVSPAMASTYAYVNPVIAVFLGWLIGDEVINGRVAFAAIMIVAAVATITTFQARRTAKAAKKLDLERRSEEGGQVPVIAPVTQESE